MTVTSYPGVYMEEIAGGAKPIEAAGTSTAAFFGVSERGPIGEMCKIFSFADFEKLYGGFRSDGQFLAHAAYQFFNNGGKDCYIGRVSANYKTAGVTILDRNATDASKAPSLTIEASSPGGWGNTLMAVVSSDPSQPNTFDLAIVDEVTDLDTGLVQRVSREAFADLSMDPDSPRYVEPTVNNASVYVRVTVQANAAGADAGYFETGLIRGADDVVDFIDATQRKFRINVNGDGWRVVDISSGMTGKDAKKLKDVADAIKAAISNLTPLRGSTDPRAYKVVVVPETPDATKPNERKLLVTSGLKGIGSRIEIRAADSLSETVTGALSMIPMAGAVEVYGHSVLRPMNTSITADVADGYYLGDDTVDTVAPRRVSAVVKGEDGTLPQPIDYANALHWLDKIADVSLIAVPGVGSAFVADSGMSYCRNRPLSDCFFIADMPSYYDTLTEAKQYVQDVNTPNSYGAVYFPWLKMPDPTGSSTQPIVAPPSGFVAGMYAQIDARRGVWKAPAGLDAALAGAVGMTVELTDQEHGDLNKDPKSVCVIRKFPGSGMVLWGARTLSSDPEYNYIPVRRTAIMLRKSIFNGIQWAVFEGNDDRLWSALRLNIGSFMNGLFRAGAFQGTKASDAYFVRCGLGDTMTQGDIDRGQVIVLVGFAPLKPAEFVIVRIQQKVGQSE